MPSLNIIANIVGALGISTENAMLNDQALDAFGRVRAAPPQLLSADTFQNDIRLRTWQNVVAGGAAAPTHALAGANMRIEVTASGQRAARQTYLYHPHSYGKSTIVFQTVLMREGGGAS